MNGELLVESLTFSKSIHARRSFSSTCIFGPLVVDTSACFGSCLGGSAVVSGCISPSFGSERWLMGVKPAPLTKETPSLEEPDEEPFLVHRYRNSGKFVDGGAACGKGFGTLDAALRPAELVV